MNWVKLTAMDKSENNSLQKVANKNENDEIVSKNVKPTTTIKVNIKNIKLFCLEIKLIKIN